MLLFFFQSQTLLTLCKLYLQCLLQHQTVGQRGALGVSVGSLYLVWLLGLHQIKRTVVEKTECESAAYCKNRQLSQHLNHKTLTSDSNSGQSNP